MTESTEPDSQEKYRILHSLGRGGMGEVYLAEDRRLNRQVAIKVIRGDLTGSDWQASLEREAQQLAQLNHPNIVQIFDIIEHDHSLALVMEYVKGRSLQIHLRETRVNRTVTYLAGTDQCCAGSLPRHGYFALRYQA